MENKIIHPCLCWNDLNKEYSKFPATTILSVLENNKNNKLFFHLITPNIDEKSKNEIGHMIEKYGQDYQFYQKYDKESEKIVDLITKNDKSRFGIGTYLRLLVPSLLPKNIDKVLYLDSDIIVNKNLKKYWETNINKFFLAGVNHNNHIKIDKWKLRQYVNAGVLLINLEEVRKINILKKLQEIYEQYKEDFYFIGYNSCPDQDIINIIFNGKIKLIDKEYNFAVRKGKYIHGKTIYHYAVLFKPFRFKPCFIDKKYKDLYFKYFDKTPWKGWRPGWDIKKGFMTTGVYFFIVKMIKKTGMEDPIKKILSKRLEKRI